MMMARKLTNVVTTKPTTMNGHYKGLISVSSLIYRRIIQMKRSNINIVEKLLNKCRILPKEKFIKFFDFLLLPFCF